MNFIAELCQNHNGSEKLMLKMIDEAAEGGAKFIKIQHIYSENLSFRPVFDTGSPPLYIKRPYNDEYNRLKNLELSFKSIQKFLDHCKNVGVVPLTTIFAQSSIKEILDLGFKQVKIASYDCASFPMLSKVKENFDHIFVSTGATFDSEVEKAVKILNENFTLLHCVTIYPTPITRCNFSRIQYLKKFKCEVGFSDHSSPSDDNIHPSLIAIYYGAKVIERHFSILKINETRDGVVSVDKHQIKKIIEFSNLNKTDQKEYLINEGLSEYLIIDDNTKFVMSDEEYRNRLYYRGRFCSKINENGQTREIFNWEDYD
ncbi:N-acetylneuraminate synthase family protein [Alphaproteobacteria bacterium]|nr:N-acetylneuraminate synthase family protein [Alphaproteobacteria bacterium]